MRSAGSCFVGMPNVVHFKRSLHGGLNRMSDKAAPLNAHYLSSKIVRVDGTTIQHNENQFGAIRIAVIHGVTW